MNSSLKVRILRGLVESDSTTLSRLPIVEPEEERDTGGRERVRLMASCSPVGLFIIHVGGNAAG